MDLAGQLRHVPLASRDAPAWHGGLLPAHRRAEGTPALRLRLHGLPLGLGGPAVHRGRRQPVPAGQIPHRRHHLRLRVVHERVRLRLHTGRQALLPGFRLQSRDLQPACRAALQVQEHEYPRWRHPQTSPGKHGPSGPGARQRLDPQDVRARGVLAAGLRRQLCEGAVPGFRQPERPELVRAELGPLRPGRHVLLVERRRRDRLLHLPLVECRADPGSSLSEFHEAVLLAEPCMEPRHGEVGRNGLDRRHQPYMGGPGENPGHDAELGARRRPLRRQRYRRLHR
mmetsp:Transcript_109409/g.315119  ORF Transcript_109409/g.315119 Transcript_109409/m.315119 type:complete len:284 (-) Transcript_109409:171-1022(-)